MEGAWHGLAVLIIPLALTVPTLRPAQALDPPAQDPPVQGDDLFPGPAPALLLIQARMPWTFLATWAQTWLSFSWLLTTTPSHFHQPLFPGARGCCDPSAASALSLGEPRLGTGCFIWEGIRRGPFGFPALPGLLDYSWVPVVITNADVTRLSRRIYPVSLQQHICMRCFIKPIEQRTVVWSGRQEGREESQLHNLTRA